MTTTESSVSVRFFHLFDILNNRNGGICIAVSLPEEDEEGGYTRNFQFARCRKGDQYCKAVARRIALGRLQKDPIKLPMYGPDWYLANNFILRDFSKGRYSYDTYGKAWEDRRRAMRALLPQ